MRIEKLDVPPCTLGEGPVWSERDQCLYYVDIVTRRVRSYTPGARTHREWQFDRYTGSLAECRSGGLIVTLQDRIVRFDPARGASALETLVVLEADRPANRLNDGKTDPWGRFWVGSMQHDEQARNGRLWCVTADGQARAVRDGIGVSNSLAFDGQRNRMYFADSMTKTIEYTTFDAGRAPTTWNVLAKTQKGGPDGSCTDADGYLWNAEWGGHHLVRYAPTGRVERVIEMPVSRPSCCTFGGPDLRTLYVTSARYLMSPEEDRTDPDAGSLYAITFDDVQGVPATPFAL
ncbi:MAG: SMP-30/gluconolactonase/LRE family protein [Myxococcales bacterium]|nr:SMP-30/gluconolactonase/LRE family protein [Myxococcales bacterium]